MVARPTQTVGPVLPRTEYLETRRTSFAPSIGGRIGDSRTRRIVLDFSAQNITSGRAFAHSRERPDPLVDRISRPASSRMRAIRSSTHGNRGAYGYSTGHSRAGGAVRLRLAIEHSSGSGGHSLARSFELLISRRERVQFHRSPPRRRPPTREPLVQQCRQLRNARLKTRIRLLHLLGGVRRTCSTSQEATDAVTTPSTAIPPTMRPTATSRPIAVIG